MADQQSYLRGSGSHSGPSQIAKGRRKKNMEGSESRKKGIKYGENEELYIYVSVVPEFEREIAEF